MDLCNVFCLSIRLAVCPSVLCGKYFYLEHYMQTVQQNVFIPALLTGTIDFYHFVLLSVL